MKKTVSVLILTVQLALLATGCSLLSLNSSDPLPEDKPDRIKIGVALYKQDDTFISAIMSSMEKYVKEKEDVEQIKISMNIADAGGSQSLQNDQVNDYITQKYDVLCINIVDRTAAAQLIDKAKSANIPIVFFNRQPVEKDIERWDKVYYVGGLAKESGIMQAQILMDLLAKDYSLVDKNNDGIIQYVMLEGEQGHQDALLRTEYAITTLTDKGYNLEKIANASANWQRAQASAKMTQWINEYKDKIEVVFANNDDMALGAIDAYKELNMSDIPVIIGVDATIEALKAMKDGYLEGTVVNDTNVQAKAIFDLSFSLALGNQKTDSSMQNKFIDGQYVWLPYRKANINDLVDIE